MHIVKSVLTARFRQNVAARHDFLNFIVRNWPQIMAKQFKWMKKSAPPALPKIDFVCREQFITQFLDAYADRRRYDEIALLPTDEQAVARAVASGMSRDLALMDVGKRAALSVAMAKEHEVRRINAEALRETEVRRRETVQMQKDLLRQRYEASRQPAPSPLEEEGFPELGEFHLEITELPPVDLSKWN